MGASTEAEIVLSSISVRVGGDGVIKDGNATHLKILAIDLIKMKRFGSRIRDMSIGKMNDIASFLQLGVSKIHENSSLWYSLAFEKLMAPNNFLISLGHKTSKPHVWVAIN